MKKKNQYLVAVRYQCGHLPSEKKYHILPSCDIAQFVLNCRNSVIKENQWVINRQI